MYAREGGVVVVVKLFVDLVTQVVAEIRPAEERSVRVMPCEPTRCFAVNVERGGAQSMLVWRTMEPKELFALMQPLMQLDLVELRKRELERPGWCVRCQEVLEPGVGRAGGRANG